jgi:kynurenine formamidase
MGKILARQETLPRQRHSGRHQCAAFSHFSVEAARFLVTQRKINGVGIDTASTDYGPSRLFEVHEVILGAGLYGLENVAHADRLPPTGATIIALPVKIKGGSGAPTRIIALLP